MAKTFWNKAPKANRLSRSEYEKKREWFKYKYPICQDHDCNALIADNHHIFYGRDKNDFCLINLCRYHHEWAHKNKYEGQERYEPIGIQNEKEWNESRSTHNGS